MFNKNLSILSTAILLCTSQAEAQYFDAYGVKFGFSSFHIDYHKTILVQRSKTYATFDLNERLISPTVSLWTTIYKSDYWLGDVELSYISKGGKLTDSFTNFNGEKKNIVSTVSYNYLQLIPSIKLFSSFEPVNPFITLGLPINYEIGVQNEEIHNSPKFLLSYQFGVGTEFVSDNSYKYFLEIKYSIDTKYFDKNEYINSGAILFDVTEMEINKKHEGFIFLIGLRL